MDWTELELHWPRGHHLIPQLSLLLQAPLPTVEFSPDLARSYACYDGTSDDPLMPEQRRATERILASWSAIVADLATRYPSATALDWDVVHVSDRSLNGVAFARVVGNYTGPDHHLEEHGVEAVLLGAAIQVSGARGVTHLEPAGVGAPVRPEVRPHPDYEPLTRERLVDLMARGLWGELRSAWRVRSDRNEISRTVLSWLESRPTSEALAAVEHLGFLVGQSGEPPPWDWVRDRPELTRALIDAGRFLLPADLLHGETEPERIRAWVALGAELERKSRPGGPGSDEPAQTALQRHVEHPEVFISLLELGADPEVLRDGYGGLRYPLSPQQRAALERLHPDFFRSEAEAPRREGRSALADWQSRGWIELSDGESPAEAERALDTLLHSALDASALLDAMLEVPGVEDLFVTEDDVDRFRATW